MVTVNERLEVIARQLRNDEKPESVTVRTLLSWFGAQRRGYLVVADIRRGLAEHGLETVPDFEFAYIDSLISFQLAQPPIDSQDAHRISAGEDDSVLMSGGVASDPTFRISILKSANTPPLSVKPDAPLEEAVTLMLKHDYSQLPVMQSDYDVKGAISWATIGKRLALGLSCTFVRDCMEPHREVSSEAPLLTVIDEVIKYEYVLIRDKTNKISGIVTTSDLGKQFRDLSEPFLLLSEIENHIRKMIDGKYTKAEIESARDPSDRQRPIVTVSDLTFGEYVRLLSNEERWRTLNLKIDRKRFVAMLDNIREIRNNIMHFDPDGISDDLIEDLREFSAMLHTLREMKAI